MFVNVKSISFWPSASFVNCSSKIEILFDNVLSVIYSQWNKISKTCKTRSMGIFWKVTTFLIFDDKLFFNFFLDPMNFENLVGRVFEIEIWKNISIGCRKSEKWFKWKSQSMKRLSYEGFIFIVIEFYWRNDISGNRRVLRFAVEKSKFYFTIFSL